jgi:hypothetical protein
MTIIVNITRVLSVISKRERFSNVQFCHFFFLIHTKNIYEKKWKISHWIVGQ